VEVEPCLLLSATLPPPLTFPFPGFVRFAEFEDVVDEKRIPPTDAVGHRRQGIEGVEKDVVRRDTSMRLAQ
jgi:hypothetical protein